ncbi:MAG: GtrA family protein [Parcubacteria group bacterium]|jgi:putative flippase GtrA
MIEINDNYTFYKNSKIYIIKLINKQFIRFIIASGANTIFGYLVFSLFIFIGFRYPIAILFATICGILFNFQTIGRFVFLNKNSTLIFRFIGVYAITYLLFTTSVGILIHFHISAYIAGAIMTLPIGITSFLLNKKLVF